MQFGIRHERPSAVSELTRPFFWRWEFGLPFTVH